MTTRPRHVRSSCTQHRACQSRYSSHPPTRAQFRRSVHPDPFRIFGRSIITFALAVLFLAFTVWIFT